MKKLVFTLGLCLVAAVGFGQKKAVTEALKLAKDAKPNFADARTKIKAALQHDETKDDAKTWFTAGQIENLQFDKENTKQILGQQPDEAVMYNALYGVYPYFSKAYDLDKLPDAKGKVKPKFTKDMKAITRANMPYYMNGGIYFYEQENFKRAYEFFDQYVVISDSPLMKEGEPVNPAAPIDSSYIYANYYAAIAAMLATADSETTTKALIRACKSDFRQNEMYQFLASIYQTEGDMVNYEKTLQEGNAIFPTDSYFLLSLIGIFIDSEQNDKALDYILKAIQIEPTNAQLYSVAGTVYEIGAKDFDKAEEYFIKSIELNGEDSETQFSLGRIYHNQAVAQLDIAQEIADVKKYNEEREKAKDFFRKAMPYIEKAFQLNPDHLETKIALRNIYYNLDMGDKLDEIDKLMDE